MTPTPPPAEPTLPDTATGPLNEGEKKMLVEGLTPRPPYTGPDEKFAVAWNTRAPAPMPEDCPVCGYDCAGANPPIASCPLKNTPAPAPQPDVDALLNELEGAVIEETLAKCASCAGVVPTQDEAAQDTANAREALRAAFAARDAEIVVLKRNAAQDQKHADRQAHLYNNSLNASVLLSQDCKAATERAERAEARIKELWRIAMANEQLVDALLFRYRTSIVANLVGPSAGTRAAQLEDDAKEALRAAFAGKDAEIVENQHVADASTRHMLRRIEKAEAERDAARAAYDSLHKSVDAEVEKRLSEREQSYADVFAAMTEARAERNRAISTGALSRAMIEAFARGDMVLVPRTPTKAWADRLRTATGMGLHDCSRVINQVLAAAQEKPDAG